MAENDETRQTRPGLLAVHLQGENDQIIKVGIVRQRRRPLLMRGLKHDSRPLMQNTNLPKSVRAIKTRHFNEHACVHNYCRLNDSRSKFLLMLAFLRSYAERWHSVTDVSP